VQPAATSSHGSRNCVARTNGRPPGSPVGRIPDGGGWRTHGKNSDHARRVARLKKKSERDGYAYLYSAVDGYSRLAYTEALHDEKAVTAVAFVHRARAWLAQHGITKTRSRRHRQRVLPRRRIRACPARIASPADHALHVTTNGRVERYDRILAEEFLYACEWTSEDQRREAFGVWNIDYNYHRPHGTAGGQRPASGAPAGVTNVLASHT
jgi:hypothetical protein